MSLTPPLRNPQGDRPAMPRPGGPETGVYIFELYYSASKKGFTGPSWALNTAVGESRCLACCGTTIYGG